MQKLIEGLHRFQGAHFGKRRALFESLSKGQSPEVLFITCSDSRIAPNLILQTEPGDVFSLRNAGNLVPIYNPELPSGEAATIEYAVKVLGVSDIVICGHFDCGAVKALMSDGDKSALPAVAHWLSHAKKTRELIESNYASLEGDKRVTCAIEENVLVQLEQLSTHPTVAAAVEAGQLALHGWVYDFKNGQVFQHDEESGQFDQIQRPEAPQT